MSKNHQSRNVRWRKHLNCFGRIFPQLLSGQKFVDVTLVCERRQIHCHRLVLAAYSAYFSDILASNPTQHPIIILPRDVKFWMMESLVEFMYRGEVSLTEENFEELVKCAEMLEIRGLNRNLSQFVKNLEEEYEPIVQTSQPQPKEIVLECPEQLNNESDPDPVNSDQSSGRTSSKRKRISSPGTTSAAPQKSLRTLKKPPNYNLSSRSSSEAENSASESASEAESDDSGESYVKTKKKRRRQSKKSSPGLDEWSEMTLEDPPDDFVLKNEATRKYNATHMWSALMRITEGLSIYRAAKIYGVPKASIMQYMKCYGIKSNNPPPF